MVSKEELLLIIYFIGVILLLTAFVIVFFVVYQRRKNNMLQEQFEAEKRFEQEIAQSRIEMQEQTLKNVGWELHDNIGQLLSVANMQLNVLSKSNSPKATAVHEIKEVVASSLQEVRALSKSLNNEVIDYLGLENSVQNELERFNRLNIITAEFSSSGQSFELLPKDSIILFRIIQESFSNVVKHAGADKLLVNFTYSQEELLINVLDNGKGFSPEEVQKSSGLLNMKSRANLINADFLLNSSEGNGTSLTLRYPRKPTLHE
ncbi:sensor histidine kinase [Salinimicrobium sp. GXAS 041]|uniref:sensor histidine kinase n=1 Tax=Salinimicrobium sp. GXAS 041 TaxID=3400806 RepID=UPI003C72560D